jgi:phosphohistidine phosphatase
MDVLLIRHAIAEPRSDEGGTQPDDRLRELTPKGRRRMKRGAGGLRDMVPVIDLLAASPLARALQTAEIVSKAYDDLQIATVPQLEPGVGAEAVVAWLKEVETSGTVALVGHEPDLSDLATYLTTAQHHSVLAFDKGGACLLEVPAGVPPGEARFVWLATARQLRRLGRKR